MLKKIFLGFFKQAFLVAFLFLFYNPVHGQDTLKVDTSGIVTVNPTVTDTGMIKVSLHSPVRAGLLSATLPGLGQVYNKKYWKVPVIYAAIGVSAYYYVRNQKLYKQYLQAYVDYSNTHDFETSFKDCEYIRDRNYRDPLWACEQYMNLFRRWRDLSVVCLAASYFLNIVDATVDGYLFDYDISEKLTLRVEPVQIPIAYNYANGVKLTLNLH
jgi:hypothetical protein